MSKIRKFLHDLLIYIGFILSSFWIIITGVLIVPQLVKINGEGSLVPLLYSLETISFAVILLYIGLKLLRIFDKEDKK